MSIKRVTADAARRERARQRRTIMNHYAKLAAMIIRVMGALITLTGIMGFAYWVSAGLILDQRSPELAWQNARLLSSGVFAIVGVAVYLVGKPIGKLIGKGLDA